MQIAPCGTLEGNLEKGLAWELGADIALFSEVCMAIVGTCLLLRLIRRIESGALADGRA